MARLTPQEARDKWTRRMKGATEDIKRGVDRVREAPGVKAAAKKEKMRQGILDAIDSGKWASRVASVTVDEWRAQMLNKGLARISAGVDGAADKQDAFFAQLFEHQDRVVSNVSKMDDLTFEARLERMTAMARGMREFRRR